MSRIARQITKGVLFISLLMLIGMGASKATLAASPEGVNSEHGEDWLNDGGEGAPIAEGCRVVSDSTAGRPRENLALARSLPCSASTFGEPAPAGPSRPRISFLSAVSLNKMQ